MTVQVEFIPTETYKETIKQLVASYYMLAAKNVEDKTKAVKDLKRLGITIKESE